jgi:hypothetical protein
MSDKVKQAKIEALNTEVIEFILSDLRSPENREPSPEYPLGGLVHITGIGQVSVKQLRGELARRNA